MRLRSGRWAHFAGRAGLAGALLLTLGVLIGPISAGQGDAKPGKGKDSSAKKGQPKQKEVKRGLQINDPKALQGYTVLAPIFSTTTWLLDMQGRVVKTWESESSAPMSTYLLENGHLLRHAKLAQQPFGEGPGAGGHIQEFGWDGDIVWDYRFATDKLMPHHDIFRMPNGNMLLILWEKKTAKEAVDAGRRPETVKGNLLSDSVYEIKPTGKTTGEIVWEWHVWDHLVQDHDQSKKNYKDVGQHPELIDINFGEGTIASIVAKKEDLEKLKAVYGVNFTPGKAAPAHADWLHCNAVAYNADLDQVLLSSPEFNEFWIIDHGTTTEEAKGHKGGKHGKGGDLLYRYGNPRAYRAAEQKDQKLFYQHNAHWIAKGLPGEGHIIVFNNGKGRPGGAHSSVDELILPVDPDGNYPRKPGKAFEPAKLVWSYFAPKQNDFHADFISGADRLPNGDTFICDGPKGAIFEVTRNREIVWKYLNPAKNQGPPPAPPPLVEVVPAFLRTTLKATEEQTKQFDAVCKATEAKLQALLTDEQKKQLKKPSRGFGGGPGGPKPQSVTVLPAALRRPLKLTDEQKKQLDTLTKEAEAKVETALTADQQKQLKDVLKNFVNAWGGAPGGGGGPPNLSSAVFRAYHYAANYPGLSGKDLKPGKTIEELQAKQPEKK